MKTPKTFNKVARNTYHNLFMAVFSVLFLLLSLASTHAADHKNINGVVREAPGIGWPNGIWFIEDRRIMVTEETEFKGDKSKAGFGAKITAKGSIVNGVFTASEIEIKNDELLYATQ
jgi:hypothetical protein